MELDTKDVRTLLVLTLYIFAIFSGSYAFSVMASGYSLDKGYAFDWPRTLVCALVFISVYFVMNSTIIKSSNAYRWIGSPRMLHILSAITFVLSVGISVLSSRLQPVIFEWLNRGLHASDDTDLLIPIFSSFLLLSVVIITILMLFLAHGKHAHNINIELDERNQKQSHDLREAIRVAPPPYFIENLAEMTDQAEDFLSIMKLEFAQIERVTCNEHFGGDGKHDGLEALIEKQRISIRAVLMAFARLAKTYDNVDPSSTGSDIEYCANLMLTLSPESDVLHKIFPDGLPGVRFKIPTGGSPAYYLVVDKRLSVKVGKTAPNLFKRENIEGVEFGQITPNEFAGDRYVKNALLPLYWQKDTPDLVNYNMIGAPEAIYRGENIFIGDTIAAIKQASHFTPDIQAAAQSYFEKDKKGRSIVSLPVATRHYKNHPSETTSPDTYLGSINLYRNQPDIFSGDPANFKFFSDFTRPLSIILARKVEIHLATLLEYCELSKKK